jgi:hypothetical protein
MGDEMSIPESQLQTWTSLGSVTNSASTHIVLRKALAAHEWPSVMNYTDYLQGSYANTTNIRGDSDVDIVVECNSIFYSNLSADEKRTLGLNPAPHGFDDFRNEVISALVSYYGKSYVDTSGANSVKVLPSDTTNRLFADVVVRANYVRYDSLRAIAEGITFWNSKTNDQIINYPRSHICNGETKNKSAGGHYKSTIRLFKNARRCMIEGDQELKKKFPSYFVECLLYNVPDSYFRLSTHQLTFTQIVSYLASAFDRGDEDKFTTQSELHWLFGDDLWQWSKPEAIDFVARLSRLWVEF